MIYIFTGILVIVIILLFRYILILLEENFDLKAAIQERNRLLEWQEKLIEEMDSATSL